MSATDFDITSSVFNLYFNPSKSPHKLWCGAVYSGTGTGASNLMTDATGGFQVNQYADFYVQIPAGTQYLITSNTNNALTVVGNLTGITTYTIVSRESLTETEFTTVRNRAVSEVKSLIPEKYRRLLSKIEGEVIVQHAAHHQSTATLTFDTSNANTVRLWRNYNGPFSERYRTNGLFQAADVSSGYATSADYTIDSSNGTTTITFQISGDVANTLERNDMIIADYYHSLPTAPKILQQLAMEKLAQDLFRRGYSSLNNNIPQQIKDTKDEFFSPLLTLLHEGKIGVDEFDNIHLYEETRDSIKSGLRMVEVLRG